MGTLLIYLSPERVSANQLEAMKKLVPDMDLLVTQEKKEIEEKYEEIRIIAGWYPGEHILRAPRLKWYQQWGAGADWLLDFPDAKRLDFVVTNVSGLHAVPMSEHIIAFLLTFARKFNASFRHQNNCEWKSPAGNEIFELSGKTLLIVGVGSIGQRTAKLASAIGMKVLGIRRNVSLITEGVDEIFSPDQLLVVLPKADFVVLTVPLTSETRGLIGLQELRAMKSTAYIFNVGRGGTIREDDLLRALQEEWIAGAGLDVFEDEPLPGDSPFWSMDNVVISAHYAGLTPNYDKDAFQIFLSNLMRYVSGKPLKNIVDKTLGY